MMYPNISLSALYSISADFCLQTMLKIKKMCTFSDHKNVIIYNKMVFYIYFMWQRVKMNNGKIWKFFLLEINVNKK